MSWVTQKALLTVVINALGYNEVKANLDPIEDSSKYGHKGYSVKPKTDLEQNFTNTLVGGTRAVLTVSYEAKTVAKYDQTYDVWTTLLNACAAVFPFTDEEPVFERDEDQYNYINAQMSFWVSSGACG